MARRPEIVCHRGINGLAPENTWAAAELAVDWGCDYIEVDVRTSLDGMFYVLHDGAVDRTTDGSGQLAGMASAEIDRLDAGAWFAPKFAGQRVPRLRDILEWARGRIKVYLDVKQAHPAHLLNLLRETGMIEQCFLWSGDRSWLDVVRGLDANVPLKLNASDASGVYEAQARYNAAICEFGLQRLTPALREDCHDRGIKVMVFEQSDDAARFAQALALGIDMINLDHADAFLNAWRTYEAKERPGG